MGREMDGGNGESRERKKKKGGGNYNLQQDGGSPASIRQAAAGEGFSLGESSSRTGAPMLATRPF
jgi:hypothetical protein